MRDIKRIVLILLSVVSLLSCGFDKLQNEATIAFVIKNDVSQDLFFYRKYYKRPSSEIPSEEKLFIEANKSVFLYSGLKMQKGVGMSKEDFFNALIIADDREGSYAQLSSESGEIIRTWVPSDTSSGFYSFEEWIISEKVEAGNVFITYSFVLR